MERFKYSLTNCAWKCTPSVYFGFEISDFGGVKIYLVVVKYLSKSLQLLERFDLQANLSYTLFWQNTTEIQHHKSEIRHPSVFLGFIYQFCKKRLILLLN
jgi:hypothetical protein